jgi:hypothetical protein
MIVWQVAQWLGGVITIAIMAVMIVVCGAAFADMLNDWMERR